MENCLFCRIIKGEVPSNKVYEDDKVYAFWDINPNAKVHVLVIPKAHIESADKITPANIPDASAVLESIPKIAALLGLSGGYRIISNVGEDGGQSVKHLHFHILGGEKLSVKLN